MNASFCWHCGGKFPGNASDENASYVIDPLGNRHRVHHVCFEDAYATTAQLTAEELRQRYTAKDAP